MTPVPRDTPRPVSDYLDRHRWPIDEWRLTERFFTADDLGRTETLFALGNGYLGLRGNVEEGRESHTQGTFINGFHETWKINHAEEAFGFARVGQTIVNAPDVKVIRLYVDDEPLLLPVADLIDYERTLDFRTGVLCREIVWRTPAGKRVRVRSQRMVSFTQRHLAVMTFEVTLLDAAAPITLSSQILNRQDGEDEYHVRSAAMGQGADPRKAERFGRRVLLPQRQDADEETARVMLGYRAAESGMTLGVGADHTIETVDPVQKQVHIEEDMAKVVYQIDAQPGHTVRLTKVAAYHTSRGVPARELLDRCRRTLDRVKAEGVRRQFEDQKSWLDDYWSKADVTIGGQSALQQAMHWNLFQVAQASARAEGAGIPAKGVTGSGYGGHYFWDTEIYVLPFLTYAYPQLARAALRFRYNMLPAARRRARDLSNRGALFPWRTINGEEASAYYAAGTAQYHIDADISYALSRYVDATGDTDFLMREAIDILVETARLWADLGFWRSEGSGSFHIHSVTGPDEYTTVVNDNLFTNVMARFNLRRAARAVRELERAWPQAYGRMVARLRLDSGEVEEWERAAEAMAIPYDEHLGIHPQDSHFLEREVWDLAHTPADKRPLLLHYHPLVIYRFQVLKQADVVLALYLQGDQFTTEQKRSNFEYYDPITTGDSTLSAVVQALIAAEVGYSDLAVRYFTEALYVDLADLHGNASDGVHVASTGGVWGTLAHGFGGFRDYNGEFSIDPRLPSSWDELVFRLTIKSSRIRVRITADAVELTVEKGTGAKFSVRGKIVHVTAAEPVVVPLEDQGPLLAGTPGPGPLEGVRRADGSIITATVPHP
ncbi:glycoside hydrolase family 65 protein [Mumia zhuanghuii]|uniref:Glycoside hydrolase family 65 protein n=1 Tax=Mumia zhuanghuii TaxID=2585211 RepID=A0A5C4MJM3_9ACTN|nr:glycosyl hydrolase family 65 protein [Mumia zhuanghuii]TNC41805.1 glycoside hydrolase family 65 protein [Mumia zhuanghuii]TNC43179.1 glycoside hydrolase family 65 protein [Mumia zhuanghuii]